jgi:predicted amidohydrolase
MLLPAYALMAQGTQIHVAAWPFTKHISDSSPVNGLLMSRAFAAQGNCFVMAIGSLLRPDDVPEPHRDHVRERGSGDEEGGSCIIAPGGNVIATAPANEETILTASVTLETVLQHKAVIDVGAHYSRPDVLQLHIDRRPLERMVDLPRSGSIEPAGVVSSANANLSTDQSAGGNEQQAETKNTRVP